MTSTTMKTMQLFATFFNNGTNIHMRAVCHLISREIIIPDHCISYQDKYKCNSTFQRRVKSHPGLHFCCSTMLYGLLRKLVQPSESIKCKMKPLYYQWQWGRGGGFFQLLNYTVKNTEQFFLFLLFLIHTLIIIKEMF